MTNIERRDFVKWLLGTGVATAFPFLEAEAKDSRPNDLRGTKRSLDRQRRRFVTDNLSMLYERDLKPSSYYRESRRLVSVDDEDDGYYIAGSGKGRSLTRPYASLFLKRLQSQFYKEFKDRFKVSSLTRSREYQEELRKINPNATLPDLSPHVRAVGIDISKKYMNSKQRRWMRENLVSLEDAGVLEATEEMKQATFHIMPFKNYTDYVRSRLGMNNKDFERYYERTTGGVLY